MIELYLFYVFCMFTYLLYMEILTLTPKELIYLSYSNLAMAHSALDKRQDKYNRVNYMIRSRLYKGLSTGKMSIQSIFDDEKAKLLHGNRCSYCGSTSTISMDHIFAQKFGGTDVAENLIPACRHCNSSKGTKDLFEWYYSMNNFPPLLIIRRYLKLVWAFCDSNNLLDIKISEIDDTSFPFKFKYIPITYPQLNTLILLPNI